MTEEDAENLNLWHGWTRKQPTEPGIYWLFREEGRTAASKPLLVSIAKDSGDQLWLIADWGEFLLDDEQDGFAWMGPLKVPRPPETTQ